MNNQPSVQGVQNVTIITSTVYVGRRHCVIVNSGAATCYLRLNGPSATVSDFPVGSGKSLTLDCDSGDEIHSISAICGGADVTTLSYLAWN